MEVPKLIILLCCIYQILASEHTIPVEHYETELQNLGQHLEIPETPVRVIKITKTVAVKIPVPYPVKVIEKVPYPVHVSKPYPVPVPQIVHVPHAVQPNTLQHKALDVSHPGIEQAQHGGQGDHSSYKVQDAPSYGSSGEGEHSYYQLPQVQSYEGNSDGNDENLNSYNGHSGDSEGNGSFESKSYDRAIKDYLQKQHPNVNGESSGYHYH